MSGSSSTTNSSSANGPSSSLAHDDALRQRAEKIGSAAERCGRIVKNFLALARARVQLEIADTGPGIPHDIQARIFEPFFTTKPPGQGTGLGLSLCRGIIEEHGGTLGVESEPGHGATFRIELPLLTRPASA